MRKTLDVAVGYAWSLAVLQEGGAKKGRGDEVEWRREGKVVGREGRCGSSDGSAPPSGSVTVGRSGSNGTARVSVARRLLSFVGEEWQDVAAMTHRQTGEADDKLPQIQWMTPDEILSSTLERREPRTPQTQFLDLEAMERWTSSGGKEALDDLPPQGSWEQAPCPFFCGTTSGTSKWECVASLRVRRQGLNKAGVEYLPKALRSLRRRVSVRRWTLVALMQVSSSSSQRSASISAH